MELDGRASWAAVVVNRDAAVLLDACLRALVACDQPPREIVVVDNGSTDDSLFEMAGWPQVVVEAGHVDLGFGAGANRGLSLVDAPLVVLLQPEIVVAPSFGRALLTLFERQPRLAIAAPRIDMPGGVVEAGGEIERPLLLARPRMFDVTDRAAWERPTNVDFAPAGALALRRAAIDGVDGFDPAYGSDDYQDADLALRLRDAGWAVRYEPSLATERAIALPDHRDAGTANRYFRGRLRFALKHLSPADWAASFVPTEVARLRAVIDAATEPNWPLLIGAAAIEELARTVPAGGMLVPPLLDGAPLVRARETLAELSLLLEEYEAARAGSAAGRPRFRGRRDEPVDQGDVIFRAISGALRAQQELITESMTQNLVALLDLLGQARLRRAEPSSIGSDGVGSA